MVFKSREELGGKLDENINARGRVRAKEKPTPREQRNSALLGLLRKFRPHVSGAIMKAVEIMQLENASDQNKLKAATIILDSYTKLVKDVYDGSDEEDVEDIQPQNTPVFSLHVLPPIEEKND